MNPEMSINMFPHPFVGRGIQEARYARDEMEADGVMGYRLAPPLRFVGDYVFFRLASDPSLTEEQLIREAAALLTTSAESGARVAKAISLLEQFWTGSRKLENLESADRILREVILGEDSQDLEYLSNGVTFLTYIVRLAQPGLTSEDTVRLKGELYQTVREMYAFQGLVADIVWLPEALRMFNQRVEWMVEEYQMPFYAGNPYSEVVDRSIYPKASSKPVKLHWPTNPAEGQ
jgi:hypothetical protein